MEYNKKIAVIIGAGPAGLTAAYEILKQNTGIHPIILEESNEIGGISRTVKYNNNRIDIGGHRFFSKDDKVMDWWMNLMPIQGEPSKDDILLNKQKNLVSGGPNPESEDRVMLIRERVSRIFYLRKFFDYPISLKLQTFTNMGLPRTISAGVGYVSSRFHKREEKSLEDFMINRFGVALYRMFFEDYTEKLWGVHPSNIAADWGAQRIKGLSLKKAVLAALSKIFSSGNNGIKQKNVETSLIEQFIYPKLGPGQLWETAAADIQSMGGEVRLNNKVVEVKTENGKAVSVIVEKNDGQREEIFGDYFISSMPIKDLVAAIKGKEISSEIKEAADKLPYRDFITVGLLVNKLKIRNKTKIKTVGDVVPDTWIYIQERDVKIGRLQIFNNWSPYLLKNCKDTVWIGLEYFCNEGDSMWNMSDGDFIEFAKKELAKIDIIDEKDVLDQVRIRVKKAYPAYFGTYSKFPKIKEWLDAVPNLYCVGRNGQHRYNNMDHSMLTAMEAVNVINKNIDSKASIWAVNSEEEYHETKK
ncbi:MAG: NAD(P)/FAD-dependent oxidoreductase [Bacillota bacterium]|nr:NAD(P)/FAD-dependent oxidoreductase [Bacillota bacterium]